METPGLEWVTRMRHKPLNVLTWSQMRLLDLQLPIPGIQLMIGKNLKIEEKLVVRPKGQSLKELSSQSLTILTWGTG